MIAALDAQRIDHRQAARPQDADRKLPRRQPLIHLRHGFLDHAGQHHRAVEKDRALRDCQLGIEDSALRLGRSLPRAAK